MLFFYPLYFLDVPEPWQMGIQDPASPALQGMISLHHYLMYYVVVISIAISYLLFSVFKRFNSATNPKPQVFTHAANLELGWTVLPAILLIFIAVPSFALLYSLDEPVKTKLNVNITGHQWYWTYEYVDVFTADGKNLHEIGFTLEERMVETKDLPENTKEKPGQLGRLRLLETDLDHNGANLPHFPVGTPICLKITSGDVLHCWAVPSFGIKVDACPGRLSVTTLVIDRKGTFYGQCSEICGIGHGFMPICVKSVSQSAFSHWRSRAYLN